MGRLLWVLCAGLFWASPGRSDDSMLLLSETVLPAGVDSPHAMTADADTLQRQREEHAASPISVTTQSFIAGNIWVFT